VNARRLLEGCGIGIALTLPYLWQQLAPAHVEGLYLRALPVPTVAAGAAIDVVVAALLAWGFLSILDRLDPAGTSPAWMLLTAIVPAVLLHSIVSLAELNLRLPSTTVLAALLLAPALLAMLFFPAGYRHLVVAVRWMYLCAGTSMLWVLPQLASLSMHRVPADAAAFDHRAQAADPAATPQPRIVWILLDELSYDQTFAHRQPGLALPAFDALRAESVSFSDVQPAGYYTYNILPALLRGRPVAAIRSSLNGDLSLRESGGAPWQRFDAQATLFADAQRLGWSTAIAGWFNPYCRLFAHTVDVCYWTPETNLFPGHMNAALSAWENALAPLDAKLRGSAEPNLHDEHRTAYAQLMEHALLDLADPRLRFLFFHLPIPHPPGIYNRATGAMRDGGSYLDNLELADRTLQILNAAIARSPAAAETIVIVSSDHSLRVPKWRGGMYWTNEDERVFGDQFDTRPVLLIHFPGKQSAETLAAPFPELRTHAIIETMLAGRMHTPQDFNAWLNTATR
jgi:Sulfatase